MDCWAPDFIGHSLAAECVLWWVGGRYGAIVCGGCTADASIFGGNVWAFRLPSAIAAMLLLLGLVITAHTFGVHVPSAHRDQSLPVNYGICSLAAALSFALSLEVSVWGSTGLSDMLLTSTMSGCLLSFFWAYAGQHKQQWGYLGSAFFMGMAILAKGPVGALLPVLVCFVFLLYTGELGQMALKEVPWLKGILVVLVVNLPWYALMLSRHGTMFISTFFGYHNIERYTRGVNHHGGRPWWYAIAAVAVMYFPWSFLLPRAIARVAPWKHREDWLAAPRKMRLLLFALVWLTVNFTFFWLSSSQLPSYYLPIAPAAALMASSELCEKSEGLSDSEVVRGWSKWAESAVYGLLYCVVSVLLLGLPFILNSSGDIQSMAMAAGLKQSGIHFIGGGVMSMASFLFAMQTVRANLRLNSTVDKFPSYFVHALAMGAFFLGFFNPMYRIVDSVRQQPLRELCCVARSMQDPLLMVGTRMPSVVFYSRRPVAFFDSDEEAVNAVRHESNERISSYLVFVDANSWHLTEGEVVAKRGNYLLLRIQRQAT